MILKGSQRGGAAQLARHLLNEFDNDHIEVAEMRGFMADDFAGALAEMHAVSKGTRCQQFMFSLSVNPPKGGDASIDDLMQAIDRAGERLGLQDQPRAIVVHEKNGRRHAHVVWSRIEADEMKAVPMPFFKNRLAALSKELYLEHGWELPDGHRENGWKNPLNFTLAEWQQAKRLDLDPRELKSLFRDAWTHADGGKGFKGALEDRGYFLAKGDRRGFVAVDLQGEVHSLTRMTGAKTADLAARLGRFEDLPGVEETKRRIAERLTEKARTELKAARDAQREAMRPLLEERARMVAVQRRERALLTDGQDRRRLEENRARQQRMRRGLVGSVLDILTGRAFALRRENEREAFQSYQRDRAQREALVLAQIREREELQRRIDRLRRDQRRALMRTVIHALDLTKAPERTSHARYRARYRDREQEFGLDRGL
jgi:hypothetical protein